MLRLSIQWGPPPSSHGIFEKEIYDNEDRLTYIKFIYRNFGSDFVLFPSESLTILDTDKDYGINYIVNRKNWQLTHLHHVELIIYADNTPPKREKFKLYDKF